MVLGSEGFAFDVVCPVFGDGERGGAAEVVSPFGEGEGGFA